MNYNKLYKAFDAYATLETHGVFLECLRLLAKPGMKDWHGSLA